MCRVETVRAEAADAIATAAVARGEGVVDRSLALAPPHQAVDVVGPQVIFGEAEPEVAGVGVAVTGESGGRAVQVDLRRPVESGDVAAEYVLEPAVEPHAAAPGRREHVRDHVVPRMIRRLLGDDARLAVVLRVRRGKVAAAEIIVVDLRTVVRQRLPPRLAPRDAPAVGKRRHEQRVDRRQLLEAVEHAVGAFIHERHGPYLDADHRPIGRLPGATN